MQAMVLNQPHTPLVKQDIPIPVPRKHEVLIHIEACGVCRTDLHIYDGELTHPKLPLILGHQIIGVIVSKGPKATRYSIGMRVGVPWVHKTCGICFYCKRGEENLCDHGIYTGYQVNGGFAEFCTANENFIFPIPENYKAAEAAPLLCGGLIGYRSLNFLKNENKIGFYGFGSSGHLIIQIARFLKKECYVFTRAGDKDNQTSARDLGATWAGSSHELPPTELDGAIIFAPSGELVPQALKSIRNGGSVVCAGIYMSPIPSFSYDLIYGEKILRSVTNLTQKDGEEFFKMIESIPLKITSKTYPLEQANQALNDLRAGKIIGSAVILNTNF